MFDPHKALPTL